MLCYMCDDQGITSEHVPPKCLFPKSRDVPHGKDYRRNLITVPSCELHNSAKSTDDEYLLFILGMNIAANHIAKLQLSRLIRAITQRPGLIKSITKQALDVVAHDVETDQVIPTKAFKLDGDRLDQSIDHIARGIFFHHMKTAWRGDVSSYPAFLLSFEMPEAKKSNELIARMSLVADKVFAEEEKFGENPDVFFYQICNGENPGDWVIRLSFYEGCIVTCFIMA